MALTPETRAANASVFPGEAVPTHAVTAGIATIRSARRIRLMAFGARKAEAVRAALRDPPSARCPASWLRGHPDVVFYLDDAAAVGL